MVELKRRRRAAVLARVCLDRNIEGYRNGRSVDDIAGHRGTIIKELCDNYGVELKLLCRISFDHVLP